MATVTEKVTEALVGASTEPQLSDQNRLEFLKHAIKDEATSEYYMTEHEFVEAIAPAAEDYVCIHSLPIARLPLTTKTTA
jgi:solute carrier family 25 (mitochondrial aspartate/glutamate transporter), member 12/13